MSLASWIFVLLGLKRGVMGGTGGYPKVLK